MVWLQIFLVLGLLLTGCDRVLFPRFEKSMWSSYIQMQDLKLGMSMEEVQGIMGSPAIKEEGDYRGGHYVFWFYLTHSMDYEGGEPCATAIRPWSSSGAAWRASAGGPTRLRWNAPKVVEIRMIPGRGSEDKAGKISVKRKFCQ